MARPVRLIHNEDAFGNLVGSSRPGRVTRAKRFIHLGDVAVVLLNSAVTGTIIYEIGTEEEW